MQMNRRAFLQTGAAGLLGTLAASRLAFASAPTDNRFVFVFLRGGLDGLHALPPYADADYRRLRPGLALQADQVLSLDGYFGMHPSFAPLRPMWEAGSLAFVPAAATGYRERSHFDGQNMLENGATPSRSISLRANRTASISMLMRCMPRASVNRSAVMR